MTTSASSARLINTLASSGKVEEYANTSVVILTNIVFDHSSQYHKSNPHDDVDAIITGNILDHPEMLWKMKENPFSCRENLRIDNIEVMKRELTELLTKQTSSTHHKSTYIVDISDTDNLGPLHSLSKLLPSTFQVVYSAKALPSIVSDRVPESLASRLQAQLMIGDSIPGPAGLPINIRSGCLKCQVGSPFQINASFLVVDKIQIMAHCRVQRDIQAKYPLCSAPLLVIGCGPFFALHWQLLSHVRDSGGSLAHVLLHQLVLSHSWLPYYEVLLLSFPEPSLCIDCFTHQSVFGMSLPCGVTSDELDNSISSTSMDTSISPGTVQYASDEEVLRCVLYLCRRGFSSRLCLSIDIKTKLQLRWYGGPGIGYVTDSLLPRLHRSYDLSVLESFVGTEAFHSVIVNRSSTAVGKLISFREEEVKALLCDNLLALLSWYHPPESVEVPLEKLPCHICGREFVPGDHYSKFAFVYCSSACLGKHRKLDYK